MDNGVCKSCGAPIFWATTMNGISIPIDCTPVYNGNLAIGIDGIVRTVDRDEIENCKAAKIPLHKSHFATCPNATRHLKKK